MRGFSDKIITIHSSGRAFRWETGKDAYTNVGVSAAYMRKSMAQDVEVFGWKFIIDDGRDCEPWDPSLRAQYTPKAAKSDDLNIHSLANYRKWLPFLNSCSKDDWLFGYYDADQPSLCPICGTFQPYIGRLRGKMQLNVDLAHITEHLKAEPWLICPNGVIIVPRHDSKNYSDNCDFIAERISRNIARRMADGKGDREGDEL